ncbi:MAG: DUF2889 domain-containing protein [Burkholderiales bacterium]
MPLPESTGRTEMHLRRIEMRGYRRDDGLYEIEGRITDTKSYPHTIEERGEVQAGERIHDMWVRLVVDEQLVVHDVVAATDAMPYGECAGGPATMKAIVGAQIRAGWSMVVKERLGGAKGCTHLMELLIPMATTAYQTIAPLRLSRPPILDRQGVPLKIDSCYAYARNRSIVRRRWPKFYTGPDDTGDNAS